MPVASILDPVQPTLSPLLWDHPEAPEPLLKPRHAQFIRRTIYAALAAHGYARPHEWLRLCLTGSLTTYQYADDSDCDISLFVDSLRLPEWSRAEMIGIMISEADGKVIPGTPYPLQDFVVGRKLTPGDLYRQGLRSGYDIDAGRWIVPPERDRSHNVEAEENGFYVYALQMADKMERLLRYEPDKAEQFWHQIHKRRMRDQAAGKGDFSEANIIYKFLAKRGLFPRLEELTGEHIARGVSPFAVTLRTMRRDGYSQDDINAWMDYLAAHNEADRDHGELDDVPDEQVERWYENWESEGRPRVAETRTPSAAYVEHDASTQGANLRHPQRVPAPRQAAGLAQLGDQAPASEAAQATLDANAGQDLEGLPGPVNVPGYGPLQFHSNADIQRIANEYNAANGLGAHPTNYVPVNPSTGAQIAQEYERMPHSPQDPATAAAYQALANESMAQYRHAVNNGYQFEFYPEGQDPYPHSPREAVLDLHRNKHMYVYPTETGYGAGEQGIEHPMLADSGERWGGRPVTYNDIFRGIHDFYGHAKEGLGFRHHGEDNAYRQHAAMFSPLARQALASETRGQNSFVNFGPHGVHNQTANQAETIYAPQKAGLMPDWVADPDLHKAQRTAKAVNFGPFGQQNQGANQVETVYAPQKAGLLPEWVSDPDLHQASVFARTAASDLANAAYEATLQDGGITVGLDGHRPISGYAFSPYKGYETVVPLQSLSPDLIEQYVQQHVEDLRQPGHFLGMWIDGDSVYLDVTVVEPDRQRAFDQAAGADQLAMYDLSNFDEIPVLRQPAAA